jgi:hypothetical protein
MTAREKALELKKKRLSIHAIRIKLRELGYRTLRGTFFNHAEVKELLLDMEDKVLLLRKKKLTQREILDVIIREGYLTQKGKVPTLGAVNYYLYKPQILKKKSLARRK